jgi:hypothetical protein
MSSLESVEARVQQIEADLRLVAQAADQLQRALGAQSTVLGALLSRVVALEQAEVDLEEDMSGEQ